MAGSGQDHGDRTPHKSEPSHGPKLECGHTAKPGLHDHVRNTLLKAPPSVMMFKHSVALVNVTNMMSEVIEIGGLSILSRGTGL